MKKIILLFIFTFASLGLASLVGPALICDSSTSIGVAYAQTQDVPTSWAEGVGAERGWSDLITVAQNVLNILVYLFSSVAVLMIIWGGVVYITSSGNPEKTEQAKKIITYAVIAIFIVVFTWVLIYGTASLIATP